MGLRIALLLLLLPTFCYSGMYLDDAPFEATEYGMSRARSQTYDYQFDPEVYPGYNRQDSVDNGTSVGASGLYYVSRDTLFLRIDSRDCKQNKKAKPKTCVCYLSDAVTAPNPVCDGKQMAHFCQREKANVESASYTKADGTSTPIQGLKDPNPPADHPNAEVDIQSIHVTYNRDNDNTVRVTATDYLGGGLHMANKKEDYIPKIEDDKLVFPFVDQPEAGALPKFVQKYPLNKDFQVRALEIYFPKNGGSCARLDYFGLAYANNLLFDEVTKYEVYQPDELKPPDDKECAFCQGKCDEIKL